MIFLLGSSGPNRKGTMLNFVKTVECFEEAGSLCSSIWGPMRYKVTYTHKRWPVSGSGDHPEVRVAKFSAKGRARRALKAYKQYIKHCDVCPEKRFDFT